MKHRTLLRNYWYIILPFLMLLTHCQKDNGLQSEPLNQETKRSTTKSVSADEIPEVINYIKSKSNSKMEFKLDKSNSTKIGTQRSNEDDLILTSVITDEIQQITNSYDKSNYTFNLIEQEDLDGTYFLNLVVKEYLDTYYLYIVKYIPDPLWLNTYTTELDFSNFTGTLVFYNDEGKYAGQMDMLDSVSTSSEFKDPCPSDDGSDSTGGGGDGGNPIGGDGTTGGDGGSTGGGGFIGTPCSWSIVLVPCCGPNSGTLHPPSECGCASNPTGTYFELTIDCGGANLSMNDIMDCPEEQVETCYQPNGDPCTTGCDEFGNCIETTDQVENNEVIIMTDQEKLQFNKFITNSLSSEQQDWIYEIDNWVNRSAIFNYLKANTYSLESKAFAIEAIYALMDFGEVDFEELLKNRTNIDSNQTEIDNYEDGGFDASSYNSFSPQQQPWSNISPVISQNDFVGWGTPDIERNCMEYAKAQIAKAGYQISSYHANGQTFQVYTGQNGVNNTALSDGLSYLVYALSNGIPVIAGVDAHAGSPNPQTDNTTDHFVVIVGMGSDNNGNYFTFYDNASGQTPYGNYGASPNNKLYYNPVTGLITGTSQTSFSIQNNGYTLTMIRKSKSL